MPNAAAPFIAALVQMRSGTVPAANRDAAVAAVREAKAGGAAYVQTPEMTNLLANGREQLLEAIVTEESDITLAALREAARETGLFVHIGSLALRLSAEKAVNRAFLIDPQGEVIARYDKIHMFDVDLADGESYRESRSYQPGETAVKADTALGEIGLSICYDLRFPALYRALAESGATILTVPSAFTQPTGEAHWHVLLRARAIENGAFVLAAAQCGTHESGRKTYGHSLAVDPWGRVLADGGTEPQTVFVPIDPADVTAARRRIPSLDHGRRFAMTEPAARRGRLHLVDKPA